LTGINYISAPSDASRTAAISPYVAQLITMLIGSPEFQRR